MIDKEKVRQGVYQCLLDNSEDGYETQCLDCPYFNELVTVPECKKELRDDFIAMIEEQEKLVDVDALREKLGLAKDCAKCKQNTWHCQYDSHFSLYDFCVRFDMAIEELK